MREMVFTTWNYTRFRGFSFLAGREDGKAVRRPAAGVRAWAAAVQLNHFCPLKKQAKIGIRTVLAAPIQGDLPRRGNLSAAMSPIRLSVFAPCNVELVIR